MGRASSGIIWFDDEEFLEREIYFPEPSPSKWRLVRKICEHEYSSAPAEQATESATENKERGSEACAVYLCTRIKDPKSRNASDKATLPQKGVMKIRMQIPTPETLAELRSIRATQATKTLTSLATNELSALDILTKAKCSSAPTLLSWKQGKQSCDAGVPEGYIVFMLMDRLSGVRVDGFHREMERKARDELRLAFKEAWLDCKACGVINLDMGVRNILWNSQKKKCYILDFELCKEPTEEDFWNDKLYLDWNLVWVIEGAEKDMSTWEF